MTSMPIAPPDVHGSQRPRISLHPEYVSSAGLEAIELAELAGLHLDDWEQYVLVDALGERADGKWAAFEVGLVVPRQNGKGTVLEARELAGLFAFGENLLIHSAHEQATSSEHFRRLLTLIEGVPEFDRRVLRAVRGKGSEAIELRGGQRILFKTRTGGGGRGLTGDFVALDEAMILPTATTGALVPTMAARSIQGNPQLFYAASAVDRLVHEHGLVLARLRDRAMRGVRNLAYFEWSADAESPDKVSDEMREDPEVWAQANPGLGIRISVEHVSNECGGALAPREFVVERLGVGDWPDIQEGTGVIDLERFRRGIDLTSAADGRRALAIDVSPDRSLAAIGAVGFRADGKPTGEILRHDEGTDWVVDALAAIAKKERPVAVVVDGQGSAASLLPAIADKRIRRVKVLDSKEYAQACGMFFDAVHPTTAEGKPAEEPGFYHRGTDELIAAAKGVAKRPLGDRWAWARKTSSADITPLVTVTLALWGMATRKGGKSRVIDVSQLLADEAKSNNDSS